MSALKYNVTIDNEKNSMQLCEDKLSEFFMYSFIAWILRKKRKDTV